MINSLSVKNDASEIAQCSTLKELYEATNGCQRCSLGATRTNYVFGSGTAEKKILLIGEAPGAEEDIQGLPFVGRSGQLLTKIIEAINFKREEIYIANVIKCRPPANRTPVESEVKICIPILKKQIEIIRPKIILALGRTAANGLFGHKESLGSMRKKVHIWENVKIIVTFHPAALLRNPNWKKDCWEDVQLAKKIYDEST